MTNDKTTDRVTAPPREAMIVVIAGMLAIAFGFLMTEADGADDVARWPYVWREVVIAYFLCALPAARWLELLVVRQKTSLAAACGAAAVLTAVWLGTMSQANGSPLQDASTLTLNAIRTGLAVVVATATLILSRRLCWIGIRSFHQSAHEAGTNTCWRLFPLLASLLFVGLVPAAFVDSRQTYTQKKLAEYLAVSRLGQARRLAGQLCVLSPNLPFGKATIQQIAVELDDRVRQIERQISTQLPSAATVNQRLERARLCAILGRVAEARKTLQPLVSTNPPHAPACVLLGTAYEWAEDWPTSLGWYLKAREGLLPHRQLPPARPLLLQATKGIAYTQRKQGRLREAEAAYQEALELAPTADMHFLIAQFYEDGQQSAKALQHVRAAMEMDRKRYDAPGRDMIDKLVTQHFGCLSVFHRLDRE